MAKTQLTVTVSPELGRYVEERSTEMGVKKSVVVSRALEADKEHHVKDLLREGYEEMAGHDRDLLTEFEHVDGGTPLPDYSDH